MSAQLVFLVTGASSGLGKHLTTTILAAGHKVIATMRNPERTPDLVAEIEQNTNGACIQLDVTADDLEARVEECIHKFGRIDVLINNAGYGYGGALEDCSLPEIRRNLETNFFGALRTTRALIPHLRGRGGGTIVNVTSTEGVAAVPGLSVYAAGKHALEGASEAWAGELAAFGIRVVIAEPGAMRTAFLSEANAVEAGMSAPYRGGVVEAVMDRLRSGHGKQMIDPARAAKAIVAAVVGDGEGGLGETSRYLRLPLGTEMLQRSAAKVEMIRENMKAMEEVAEGCDFEV